MYLKVVGNCPNARFTIALEDKDMKTIASGTVGVSNSSLIKVTTFNYDGTTEIAYTSIVLESFKTNSNYDCMFYPMLLKNTYTADVAYEQYGASPSLEFPSEIETVKDSVKIDVVNSNLLDFNVAQNSKVTVNEDGTLTINGTGGFSLNIDKLQLKAGITYYQKVELISGSISGSNINNTFLSFTGSGAWISSVNFSQTILNEDTEKTSIWVNASAIFNNAVIKIWANTDESDFILHQSQTAIMPIQQEMLTGDYVADIEHHEWGKVVLTGEEVLIDSSSTSTRKWWGIDFSNYGIYQYNDPTKTCDVLTTKFKSRPQQGTFLPGQVALITNNKNMYFVFEPDATEEQARAILKDMPVYFRLATPINLELTEEQKAVRNQKLYTYKNITNINVSDELASIDVEYKKNPATEHDDLQNQIDEIKQLISTTETSALLLDNLQKDVESEVE